MVEAYKDALEDVISFACSDRENMRNNGQQLETIRKSLKNTTMATTNN